ncbi:hypothetical protein D3C71_1055980 [compost metagenome]
MPKISIRHRTTYSYRSPVQLSPYRLLLRPREGPELLLKRHQIAASPGNRVFWTTDVFGNAVATVTFSEPTKQLEIVSHADVDLKSPAWPVFDIAASGASYPFRYEDRIGKTLAPSGVSSIPILGELQQWVKGFVMENSTDTLSLLKDLSAGVSNGVAHNARDTGETQPPLETISLRCGSCQDLATLFAESVRVLASGRGSCPDIFTTRRTPSSVRRREARPMHGLKFSFRVRDGSPSTRQIGAWAALT